MIGYTIGNKDLGYDDSNIHGVGLHTYTKILRGDKICITHRFHEDGRIEMLKYGNYNHSRQPNCEIKKIGEHYVMFSLRQIESGEELTVDYEQQEDLEQPTFEEF